MYHTSPGLLSITRPSSIAVRRAPGIHPYVLPRAALCSGPRALRVSDSFPSGFVGRAPDGLPPLALPQSCPFSNVRISSGCSNRFMITSSMGFSFSTFGKQRFHAGFMSRFYGLRLSASYRIGWRLGKMPERSVRSLGPRRKPRLKQRGDESRCPCSSTAARFRHNSAGAYASPRPETVFSYSSFTAVVCSNTAHRLHATNGMEERSRRILSVPPGCLGTCPVGGWGRAQESGVHDLVWRSRLVFPRSLRRQSSRHFAHTPTEYVGKHPSSPHTRPSRVPRIHSAQHPQLTFVGTSRRSNQTVQPRFFQRPPFQRRRRQPAHFERTFSFCAAS